MKKKTIKHSHKKSFDGETDESFLNKLNQDEKDDKKPNIASTGNNYSSQDDTKPMNVLQHSKSNK